MRGIAAIIFACSEQAAVELQNIEFNQPETKFILLTDFSSTVSLG